MALGSAFHARGRAGPPPGRRGASSSVITSSLSPGRLLDLSSKDPGPCGFLSSVPVIRGLLDHLPTSRQEQQPLRRCCLCSKLVVLPTTGSLPALLHLCPKDLLVQMSTLESPWGSFSASVEVTVETWACKLTHHVKTLKQPGRQEAHVSDCEKGVFTDGKPGKRPLATEVKGIPLNTPTKARRPSWRIGKSTGEAQRLQGAAVSPWQCPTLACWRA